MITPQDFVTFWGSENLIRYEPAIVETLNLSAEAKRFLIEAGLPKASGSHIFDLPPNNFPPLTEIKYRSYTTLRYRYDPGGDPLDFPAECQRYRVFGVSRFSDTKVEAESISDIDSFYCLDQQEGERIMVVTLDPARAIDGSWTFRFLNTSFVQFAEFLCLITHHKEWIKECTVDLSSQMDAADEIDLSNTIDAYPHGIKIGPTFRSVDPPACEKETGWWELIFYMENGM